MFDVIYERLAAEMGTALEVAVIKGFPAWGRPGLEPPIAALETLRLTAERPTRIGQATARRRAEFTLTVFGRHEAEALRLAQRALDWLFDNSRFIVNGITVDCEATEATRHANESGVQQEAYAFAVACALTWST